MPEIQNENDDRIHSMHQDQDHLQTCKSLQQEQYSHNSVMR
jgi:hypothetical protein